MAHETVMWLVFGVVVAAMLYLDLRVFHRRAHEVRMREALTWSAVWIGLSLLFAAGVYLELGHQAALEFMTAYLIEKSLSVDNLFVFLMVFSYFGVAAKIQHKVLFWGILSALVMRAVFIGTGVALIRNFHWIIYLFGAFLIYTGVRMFLEKDREIHPERNPVLRLVRARPVRRFFPITKRYVGNRFIARRAGYLIGTPLLIVLLVVETTDLVFATDSIPAVLAITTDLFIVYTSNIFAILGLRALYFALAGVMKMFHHLHYGLSLILAFVGVKMLIADFYKIPIGLALGVVAGILALSVATSVIWPPAGREGNGEAAKRPNGEG
jgi:tellurite resistance protein TerC